MNPHRLAVFLNKVGLFVVGSGIAQTMKITLPWSRRRWTQPHSWPGCPMISMRRSQQPWLRMVEQLGNERVSQARG